MKISATTGIITEHTQEEIEVIEADQLEMQKNYKEPIPASVSRMQIITGLALIGWITEEEGLEALSNGAIPLAVEAVINQLPEEDKFKAKMKWMGFTNAYRDDAMVSALAAGNDKTEEDIDNFFIFCSKIE